MGWLFSQNFTTKLSPGDNVSVPDDENRRGILSKSKGQLARIASSLHALSRACGSAGDYCAAVR